MLMAGDAAGFVDPFVGDGISLALRSGALAASCLRSVLCGEDFPARGRNPLSPNATGQSLLPVFRASSTIRHMLVLPGYVRKPLLMFLESSPAITRYCVRKTR